MSSNTNVWINAHRLIVIAGALALSQVVCASENKSLDRQYVENIVKEYLLANPEIIRQASDLLAARAEAESQANIRKAIDANRNALERDSNSPVVGNPNGDITVVEFFDYSCGYCKYVAPSLKALIALDPNIRIVYKHFPILGSASLQGAKAALAAHRQGKYAAYHDAIFELNEISDVALAELSSRLGVDHARLLQDMEDPSVLQQIERDSALASSLNLNGTPGFIIGTRIIPGAVSLTELEKVIREQRKRANN